MANISSINGNPIVPSNGSVGTAQVENGYSLVTNDEKSKLSGIPAQGNTPFNSINGNPIVVGTSGIANGAVTGDKIAQGLTSPTINLNDVSVGGYLTNESGVISSTSSTSYLGLSNKVACEPDTDYVVSYVKSSSAVSVYVTEYDSDGGFVSRNTVTNLASESHTCVRTGPSTGFIHVFLYQTGIGAIDGNYIQLERGLIPHGHVPNVTMVDAVARDTSIEIEVATSINSGYIAADGSISSASTSAEVYTDIIGLDESDTMELSIEYSEARTIWAVYATYDSDGEFIERVTLTSSLNVISHGFVIHIGEGIAYIRLSWRGYNDSTAHVYKVTSTSMVGLLSNTVSDHSKAIAELSDGVDAAVSHVLPMHDKPCYDHLFVGRTGASCTIPHESLYHVRLSRKLGFSVIEANLHKTSDGVFVVNHMSSGKFGGYFHHVDGSTDISGVAVSSVTWDWIVQNVRYNSCFAKYRTRPCRLEEFLSECRQQDIVPLATSADPDAIAIIESYMGKNNYIAYNATRDDAPSATIYHWVTRSTKADILAYCESIGRPFIYGMTNPTSFTDEELEDIVGTLHAEGYWIGASYADADWSKYSAIGFDVNGTQSGVNRISHGDVCDIDSTLGFSGYTVTNATESGGVLTFSENGSVTPNISLTPSGMYLVDVEVVFNGTMTVPSIGERSGATYTSDGSCPVFITAFVFGYSNDGNSFVQSSPVRTIEFSSDTVIYDMSYKILSV